MASLTNVYSTRLASTLDKRWLQIKLAAILVYRSALTSPPRIRDSSFNNQWNNFWNNLWLFLVLSGIIKTLQPQPGFFMPIIVHDDAERAIRPFAC